MNKQEKILAEIEECILPLPATKTYITRNIAKEIAKDIAFKLDELGAVIKVDRELPLPELNAESHYIHGFKCSPLWGYKAKLKRAGYIATELLVKK